ncbi:MAG: DNA methyltransferase [Verrucomicrobia bacterium]|nr:MAG: DNA methyltransferase [Verrucomicrobiota bacterium]
METESALEPFLKWPGGKRWLVSRYSDLFPQKFERYIEPFLGSGAVFFYLNPQNAILADTNRELIATYRAVRDRPDVVSRWLSRYDRRHSKKFYYGVRAEFPRSAFGRAARFIYLNRVCFNGIYRVNLRGEFNVPLGSKERVKFSRGYLVNVAARLRRANFRTSDFESVIAEATKGDFLYVDPPYTVTHNNNGFLKYNDVLFSWEDQRRLATAVAKAARRGAFVFVSNAYHWSVRELYQPLGNSRRLARYSILSADSDGRRSTREAAFFNYSLKKPGK